MKVVYIGGYSRSGSTMLLRMLGEATGAVAVGELVYIWERGFLEDQLCGCGDRLPSCKFWATVVARMFGDDPVPAAQLVDLQRRVHGYGAFPALWLPPIRSTAYRRQMAEYAVVMGNLYRAIGEVSGARFILDSSKVPQFARVLSEVPTLDLHVVHLVRDSRGTSHSWHRQKVRTEIHWTTQVMDRRSSVRSSIEWNAFNLLFTADAHRPVSYTVVRYEDLVRDPGATLIAIGKAVGEPQVASELGSTHDEVGLRLAHRGRKPVSVLDGPYPDCPRRRMATPCPTSSRCS